MNPKGKVVVVTGGNSGLGAGAARRLMSDGATVVSFDIAGDAPEGADFFHCDVSDEASVGEAVEQAVQRHGRIDILLNNAGIGGLAPLATPDGPGGMGLFRAIVGVNLLGAAQVAAAVSHRMMANQPSGPEGERGVIVNTCSIASFEGQEGMGAYTASKSALAALTLVWARDLSRYNIRVNGVAPGFMATPMVAMLPDDMVTELLADNEFPKRAGTGEDFASAVDFIIRTPLVNGEVIRLDGGARPPARTKWSTE
jgi:NAD(P)-dependent dehydrogenase (short-subunit alcohol dehydrogenase family)